MSSFYNKRMVDNDFLKKLGLKLKILRSIKNISQDDIANGLNIDKSYYSKVERGITNPTITYLKHLSDFMQIELTELLDFNIKL